MRSMFGIVTAAGIALGAASTAQAQFAVSVGNPYTGGVSVGTYGVAGYPGYGYGYGTGLGYGMYSSGYSGLGGYGVGGYGLGGYGVTTYAAPYYGYNSFYSGGYAPVYRNYGYAPVYGYGGYRGYGYGYGRGWGGMGYRGGYGGRWR